MSRQTYAKAKGRSGETAFVDWLRQWWPGVERRRLTGAKDQGDIAGLPGWCCEVKHAKTIALAQWVDEMVAETANCRERFPETLGVLLIRRKGKPDAGDGYAVMPAKDWAYIALRLAAAEDYVRHHSATPSK